MDSFNIFTFLKILSANRRKYYKVAAITFVLGVIYTFSLPKEYTATTTFAPEFTGGADAGGLGSLASMAGINLNGLGGDEDAFFPDLYPEVVGSTTFLRDMARVWVTSDDGSVETTLEDYMRHHTSLPWWSYVVRIPGRVIKMIAGGGKSEGGDVEARRISEDEASLLHGISKCITIGQDKTNGIINLSVTLQDPYIASVVADSVSEHLQRFIYSYRTSKAAADLAYYKRLCADAESDYKKALAAYSLFQDTHQGLSRMTDKAKETELENELQVTNTVYANLKQQEAMAYAKLQSKVPVYNVVQPSMVPIQKSAPKRMTIILFMEILAFCGLSGWLLVKDWLKANRR